MKSQETAALRVCYFGTYEKEYPGNRVLIEGLRRNGVTVFECHVSLWEKVPNKPAEYFSVVSMVPLLFAHILANLRLLWKLRKVPDFDVLIVGFNGHLDVFPARLVALFRGCPLVLNPMLSIYDTLVDKQYIKPGGMKARFILMLERLIVRLPDAVFLDADAHFEFFRLMLGCPRRKYRQVYFGADDRLFFPRTRKGSDGTFKVLFYGKFQQLQGVPYIIKAAKMLEADPTIKLRIIGRGPDSPVVDRLVSELRPGNVELIDWVSFQDLQDYVADADVCLGIFGVTDKVNRCIANKVIQALAMAKPVITGDCAATRELLVDGEHAVLCELGNPKAIAASVLRLKADSEFCLRLARNGHELFLDKCSPQAIGARAKQHLLDIVQEHQGARERRNYDSAFQALHR
ncbi:MAG: glycosyltransferase [Chloroflexi bacterium]|nr:glycosyltransferase [Chloroflexota bacterium]MDA8189564.1 glycosyltransferase [Dehalococcoidales bacterium]